ncbi:hypothetical protein [Chryseobacterium gambrini]|uniref:hypothetical protein n=1 Tax=Chryseobacterium gambrini TaxID=373672 RepID=UPI003D0AF7A0
MNQEKQQQVPDRKETGDFYPPIRTGTIDLLLKANPDHPIAKEYLEKYKEYNERFQNFVKELPEKKKIILPELKPADVESLYEVFKKAYRFFRGVEFDENLNKKPGNEFGEGGILARTICAYLLKKKSFFKSPLLNKSINEPNFKKGLLIIGGLGIGKTSIMKTFYDMFLFANSNHVGVLDVEGTLQNLSRYKLGFKFFTSHEVVQDFHASAKSGHEKVFYKKHSRGIAYYDDLMTEKSAFGKDELFSEILEERYTKDCLTMISVNYIGKEVDGEYTENLDTTLDAMAKKYGERVYDRSYAMFNMIELTGKSLRK